MAKLKIGFIGCGGIANQKHLPGMSQQTEHVDLCAFCDLIPERAEKAAAEKAARAEEKAAKVAARAAEKAARAEEKAARAAKRKQD